MLWDHICTAFWFHQSHHKKHASESYSELADDDKRLVDAMFVTLCTILELDDDRAKSCALHGLGHLHHPGVAAIVQRFIGSLRDDAKVPEAIDWLEKCRDSTVM
jgi:hypothetical protein